MWKDVSLALGAEEKTRSHNRKKKLCHVDHKLEKSQSLGKLLFFSPCKITMIYYLCHYQFKIVFKFVNLWLHCKSTYKLFCVVLTCYLISMYSDSILKENQFLSIFPALGYINSTFSRPIKELKSGGQPTLGCVYLIFSPV